MCFLIFNYITFSGTVLIRFFRSINVYKKMKYKPQLYLSGIGLMSFFGVNYKTYNTNSFWQLYVLYTFVEKDGCTVYYCMAGLKKFK